jgi:hypothetical protein
MPQDFTNLLGLTKKLCATQIKNQFVANVKLDRFMKLIA